MKLLSFLLLARTVLSAPVNPDGKNCFFLFCFVKERNPWTSVLILNFVSCILKWSSDGPARLSLCVRCVDKSLFSFAFISMSIYVCYKRFFPFDLNMMQPLCLMVFVLNVRWNSQTC